MPGGVTASGSGSMRAERHGPVDVPLALLRAMFGAAVRAADPVARVSSFLPSPPPGRLVVVGAGKASARMAQAVEMAWDTAMCGLVVTRYGHAAPCAQIEIVQAAHPVPDSSGERAARRIRKLIHGLSEDELVLVLLSGGGSSLLALPAPGVSLADKQAISAALLRSGASISEMNVVRKHLSAIKGGRLASAIYPARTVGLLVSDVPGDDPGVIASRPTVGEASTPLRAMELLEAYGVEVSPNVRAHLMASGSCPGPDDPRMSRVTNHLIATPQQSLEAAAEIARAAGVTPVILGDSLEGVSISMQFRNRSCRRPPRPVKRFDRERARPVTPPRRATLHLSGC